VDPIDDRRAGLAPAYELALELEADGLSREDIADRLGVPVEAIRTLLAVAHAKADHTNA
jgi:DNA-directed RNA polymerase specialized sigma24 family protein